MFNDAFFQGLSVCFILSFILGLERQVRRRSLGLRTMILVAIGSYMFVSFSFLVTEYTMDASRIAAQVVAGIGFLGAGVIIKDNAKNQVKGLTTAATLWCDAALGILCAAGLLKEATISALFVLLTNVILRYINNFINYRSEQRIIVETFQINITTAGDPAKVMDSITNFTHHQDNLENVSYKVNGNDIEVVTSVKKSNENIIGKFVQKLSSQYKLKSYEVKKISESKPDEENDEL